MNTRTTISIHADTLRALHVLREGAGATSIDHLLRAVVGGIDLDHLRQATAAHPPPRRGRPRSAA